MVHHLESNLPAGSVYVASTAIFSSYTQTYQSLCEASNFPGVSVVLGLSPLGINHIFIIIKQ